MNSKKREVKAELGKTKSEMFDMIKNHYGLVSNSETIRRLIKKEYDNLKKEGKIEER